MLLQILPLRIQWNDNCVPNTVYPDFPQYSRKCWYNALIYSRILPSTSLPLHKHLTSLILTTLRKLRKDAWMNFHKKPPNYATVYHGEALQKLKNRQVSTVSEVKFSLSKLWGHRRKVQVLVHAFLPLVLDRSDWSTLWPSHFTTG
jgi:hypothetical protein